MAPNGREQDTAPAMMDEIEAWLARCPSCEEDHITMLVRAGAAAGPWVELIGGATKVEERDYYCEHCRSFVNLKEPENWERVEQEHGV